MHRNWTIPALSLGLAVIATLTAPVGHDKPVASSGEERGQVNAVPRSGPVQAPSVPNHALPASNRSQSVWALTLTHATMDLAPAGPARWAAPGDLLMKNDRIAITIAQAGEGRGLFPTGGHLIDADVIRRPGEPGGDRFREMAPTVDLRFGQARSTRILADGRDGTAIVRVTGEDGHVGTLPFLDILGGAVTGIEFTTDYILEAGVPWVRIRTTVRNPTGRTLSGMVAGDFLGMGSTDGLFTTSKGFASPDAFTRTRVLGVRSDRVAYAYVAVGRTLTVPIVTEAGTGVLLDRTVVLPPGASQSFERRLVVGRTLSDALDTAMRLWGVETHAVSGRAGTSGSGTADGDAVAGLRVQLHTPTDASTDGHHHHHEGGAHDDDEVPSRVVNETITDRDGGYRLTAPPGIYDLSFEGTGRPTAVHHGIRLDRPLRIDHRSDPAANIQLDFDGPIKLTAAPIAPGRTHGRTVHYSNDGGGTLPLAPGRWRLTASRGMDYELVERVVALRPGESIRFEGVLERAIQATRRGWVAADFHQHTVGSPDGEPTVRHKLVQNIAEGCQVAVISDHDRVTDPRGQTSGLGGPLLAIPGIEASPAPDGHVNVFPILPGQLPDGSRLWAGHGLPGLLDSLSQMPQRPLVVLNHPRLPGMGIFQHLRADPFRPEAPGDFDAIEVNDRLGSTADFLPTADERMRAEAAAGARTPALLDWFGWLNAGRPVAGLGVSDSHKARQGTCHSRTYLWTGTGAPEVTTAQVLEAIRAQRAVVARGLFLDVRAAGGRHMGHRDVLTLAHPDAEVTLAVRLEAPSWVRSESITIFDRGRPVPLVRDAGEWRQAAAGERGVLEIPASRGPSKTVRADLTVRLRPGQDAWYVVVARGSGSGKPVFSGKPFAFTNPIYVDTDGDGVAILPLNPPTRSPAPTAPAGTTVASAHDPEPRRSR